MATAPKTLVKYRATARCFVAGSLRNKGDVFEAEAGLKGKAFVLAGSQQAAEQPADQQQK